MEIINKTNTKEHTLWFQIRQGNTTALGQLYDLYIDSLISYGIKISGDKSYTMDCIHDLFVDLYKYKNKLSETDNIKFYLFTALKRKINKKYRVKEVCFDKNELNSTLLYKENYIKPVEDYLVEKETQQQKVIKLNTLLNKLTEKQRQGLKLRFEEGLSYEDIATMLNVSVASARTNIYRAIKTLRKHPATLVIFSWFQFF